MVGDNNLTPRAFQLAGDRLKQAREQLGWSVQETAQMLHVIPRYVHAIENSDFAELPGLVFLKGYVRAYARLVDLPENRVIADLERELEQNDDPILSEPATTVGTFSDQEIKSKKPFWYSILAVVAVILGFLCWGTYQYFFGEPAANNSEAGEHSLSSSAEPGVSGQAGSAGSNPTASSSLPAATRDPVTGEIKLNLNLNNAATEMSPAARLSPPSAADLADESESQPVPGVLPGAAVSPQNSLPGTSPSSVTPVADSNAAGAGPSAAVSAPATAPRPVQAAAAGLARVVATFTGDCWFDVRDKNNERIVGLYRAGDRVNFSGQFPLKIIVGAVNAATLRVNNRILDFSQYEVSNNRVQFTLQR